MKRLTASFGHNSWSGVWISLRSDNFDPVFLTITLQVFGCDDRFAPKVLDMLRSSGRYDCCVQGAWIRNRPDFFDAMRRAGVEVVTDPDYMPVRRH